MSKDFLIEIGCEEIPARFINTFTDQLNNLFDSELKKLHIAFDSITVFATYRRLIVHVINLAEFQTQVDELIKGPPKDIAYEKDSGDLSNAGKGFLKKCKITQDQLLTKKIEGREYIAFLKKAEAQKVELLLPNVIQDVFEKLPLPIAMKWGNGEDVFIRPIHWICALFGNHKLAVNLFGVQSNNKTYGHRFLTHGKDVNGVLLTVSSPKDYFDKLFKKGLVTYNQNEREIYIKKQLEHYKQQNYDEDLLHEVVNLVEQPTVLIGEFDSKFLSLPAIVLVECMKKHQKYFPLYDDTTLTNKFLFVADNVSNDNKDIIISGNQRVLSARLEDALFFWNEDAKHSLSSYSDKLKGLLYQKNLGSMHDKQERLARILVHFNDQGYTLIDPSVLEKCARLAKLDLVTQMVLEFPKLQGQMGGLYLLNEHEDVSIAKAVSEQYLPSHYGGELPDSPLGLMLSLSDRLDHLIGSFYNGAKPTGSQDPLGLRRVVYSVFSMLFYLKKPFDFKSIVSFCYQLYAKDSKHEDRLYDFVNQRLKSFLIDQGLRYDVAEAVMHLGYINISNAVQIGLLLEESRSSDLEQFKVVVETAVRVKRLAVKSNNSDLSVNLFKNDIEKESHQLLEKVSQLPTVTDLTFLSELSTLLVTYFEDVMVMDKAENIKANRLAFMKHCDNAYLAVADFEKIVLD